MLEALRRVVQRMHYPLEVMLVCVRWYAAQRFKHLRTVKLHRLTLPARAYRDKTALGDGLERSPVAAEWMVGWTALP